MRRFLVATLAAFVVVALTGAPVAEGTSAVQETLFELANLVINPRRPDRHEPRVVKDLQDSYTKMCRPREQLRKELKKQAVEA